MLEEAEAAVAGPRQHYYGDPRTNLSRIAMMWSAIFGHLVSPEEVCMCMIAVKLGRLVNTPAHRDSWVDIAGYVRVADLAGCDRLGSPVETFHAGEEA